MAFSNTMVGKYIIPGGLVCEYGTWEGTAATTTGNITADTTVQPEMVEILEFGASSNADDTVKVAQDAGLNVLKLTFTATDKGKYFIKGRAK